MQIRHRSDESEPVDHIDSEGLAEIDLDALADIDDDLDDDAERDEQHDDLDAGLAGQEAELDSDEDEPGNSPVMIERFEPGPGVFDVEGRGDVLPPWVTSWQEFKDAVRTEIDRALFRVKFHASHSPLYALRLLLWSPIGLWRLTKVIALWVADVRSDSAREALVESVRLNSRGTTDLRVLTEQHRLVVRLHLTVATVGLVLATVVALWVAAAWPWYQQLLALGGAVAALGMGGRPQGKTITDRAISVDRPERLTWDLIEEALRGLNISGINKAFAVADKTGAPVMIHKVTPVKEVRTGWAVELDLPRGVTVNDVAEKRSALASGLRRPASCVWPERGGGEDEGHEGRLSLFVSNRPLRKMPKRAWPLLDRGATSIFDPIPLGVDARGNPVRTTLFENSVLVGALPGMGKTKAALILAMGAALDPTVEVHVHDFKGMGDWAPMAQVAHVYNARAEDPDPVGALLADLKAVQADMERRAGIIGRLVDDNPSLPRKLTPEFVAQRSLDLVPVVVAIDECQVAFLDPDHGKEIGRIADDIIRRGRALGVILILSTQKPSNEAIPTGVRDNVSLRFCLKVMSSGANNMILGDGAYGAGFRATEFARSDMGIGYYAGPTGDPTIVRLDFVEDESPVMARARAAKERLGRLTGYAAGEADSDPDGGESMLDHLIRSWSIGEGRLSYARLAEILADGMPDTYSGMTARQVSAYCRTTLGLPVAQCKVGGQNRDGVRQDQLLDAAADQELARADTATTAAVDSEVGSAA